MIKSAELHKQAEDYLRSEAFKKLVPYLLSGGVGAAAGAMASGGRRKKEGEGRLGYLGRILGNAALAGGLAGGGHYLLSQGTKGTLGNIAVGEDDGPLQSSVKNIAFSPATAAASGALGLAATSKGSRLGATPSLSAMRELGGKEFLDRSMDSLKNATPGEMDGWLKSVRPEAAGKANRLRQQAGLASGSGLQGLLSSLIRKSPLSTFGQTNPTRLKRGLIGLTAAGIPALIGSLITPETTKKQ